MLVYVQACSCIYMYMYSSSAKSMAGMCLTEYAEEQSLYMYM